MTFFFLYRGHSGDRDILCCELTQETERLSLSGDDTQEAETGSPEVWQTRIRTGLVRGDTQGHGFEWQSHVWLYMTLDMFCQSNTWIYSIGVTSMDMICRGWYTGTHSVGGDIQEKGTNFREEPCRWCLKCQGMVVGRLEAVWKHWLEESPIYFYLILRTTS